MIMGHNIHLLICTLFGTLQVLELFGKNVMVGKEATFDTSNNKRSDPSGDNVKKCRGELRYKMLFSNTETFNFKAGTKMIIVTS